MTQAQKILAIAIVLLGLSLPTQSSELNEIAPSQNTKGIANLPAAPRINAEKLEAALYVLEGIIGGELPVIEHGALNTSKTAPPRNQRIAYYAQDNDSSDERICCERENRNWYTTRSQCRRARARVVDDRQCQTSSERNGQSTQSSTDVVCCRKDILSTTITYRTQRQSCDPGLNIPIHYCPTPEEGVCCHTVQDNGDEDTVYIHRDRCSIWRGNVVPRSSQCRRLPIHLIP